MYMRHIVSTTNLRTYLGRVYISCRLEGTQLSSPIARTKLQTRAYFSRCISRDELTSWREAQSIQKPTTLHFLSVRKSLPYQSEREKRNWWSGKNVPRKDWVVRVIENMLITDELCLIYKDLVMRDALRKGSEYRLRSYWCKKKVFKYVTCGRLSMVGVWMLCHRK